MHRYAYIHPRYIGFDIDCVVADTMDAFIRLADSDYNLTVKPEEITCFQVEKCLPVDGAVVSEIFERLLSEPQENSLMPMPGAVQVLTDMSDRAPLTFITARPFERPIARWLQRFLPPEVYGNSRLVAMGSHDGKAEYVKKLGLRYFVDDRVKTCFELAEQGLNPIVFEQPWNRGRHDLAVVESWHGIRKWVQC